MVQFGLDWKAAPHDVRSFLAELLHALAVEDGEAELEQDNLPDIEDVVSVYLRLMTVDGESDIIWSVHYTTQEYFKRTQASYFPNAQKDPFIVRFFQSWLLSRWRKAFCGNFSCSLGQSLSVANRNHGTLALQHQQQLYWQM